jgi:aspartate aminotransferase
MPRRALSRKTESVTESQTLRLSARAAAMKREGIDLISLTSGEPDFPTPEHIKRAGIAAIEHNFTKYTPNNGILELLEAISIKFLKDNDIRWLPNEILVSSGAKHSIYNALQAICNPGDEVIIPAPYWVSYPEMTKFVDAKPIIINTNETSGFKITPRELRKSLSLKSKVFIFNSPSNPTGAIYSRDDIEALAEVIAECGLFVISDEIYEHLVYDDARHFSIGAIESLREQTVTVNGVSKAFSMTGWRIGYMGAHKNIIQNAAKFQGQVTSNTSSISQKAALCALTSPLDDVWRMRNEFETRRNFIVGELNAIKGISCLKPKGAFYVFPRIDEYFGTSFGSFSIHSDVDLCEYLLIEGRVATVPGSAFGSGRHIRLSFAVSNNELEKGLIRISECLSKLKS